MKFLYFLTKGKLITNKSVLLTFDDGRGTLWSVAYPMLKKYGMKATAFIVPGKISSGRIGLSLQDYWDGNEEAFAKAVNRDDSENLFVTWEEVAKCMIPS